MVTLTLLIVPALAAALVGSFKSFWLTLVGGLLIGILQSEIAYAQVRLGPDTDLSGWAASVPFLIIIVVLVVRGRALPAPRRGHRTTARGRHRPRALGARRARGRGGVALVLFVFTNDLLNAVTTTSAVAVDRALARRGDGLRGPALARAVRARGHGRVDRGQARRRARGSPSSSRSLAGVLGAIPVGVLVGLPALRTRGVNLAVATLGLALVIESQILNHPVRSGGFLGIEIGKPSICSASTSTRSSIPSGTRCSPSACSRARAPRREPAPESRRPPPHRGAHERARRRCARHQRVRRQALRVRARRRHRRRRRRAHRVPAPDGRLLPDVLDLPVDLRRRVRRDRRHRLRRRRADRRARSRPGTS